MSTYATHQGDGRQGVDAIEEVAREHPGLVVLGRLGWLAKGAVYAVAGALAISIATSEGAPAAPGGAASASGGGEEASQTGAVARIADSTAGTAALWAVAAGLALYVLWRIVTILLPAESSAKAWVTRAGYVVSVVTYSALAWTAVSFARGRSGARPSENNRMERFTADVLEHSGGRWLVGVLGVTVIAVGLYFAYQGITGRFSDELQGRDVGPVPHDTIVKLGQVGWCGRAVMTALIGFFLVRAAAMARADEAEGLDGALRRLVDTGWGAAVVAFVGIGLVLYGAYCIISTPIRRLQGAD